MRDPYTPQPDPEMARLIKTFERVTTGTQYLAIFLMLAFVAGQLWKVLS